MRVVENVSFWEFDWDEHKAESNVVKHGITFEEAAEALALPHLEWDSSRNAGARSLPIFNARYSCRLHDAWRKMQDYFGKSGKSQ